VTEIVIRRAEPSDAEGIAATAMTRLHPPPPLSPVTR
jgi:hypothetical protein